MFNNSYIEELIEEAQELKKKEIQKQKNIKLISKKIKQGDYYLFNKKMTNNNRKN